MLAGNIPLRIHKGVAPRNGKAGRVTAPAQRPDATFAAMAE
ncbi:MAG: hypothetical protein RL317_1081, partial [Pseudomonadota bacterium]